MDVFIAMEWLEFTGLASGLVCVWLLIRQNVWTFPIGLLYSLVSVAVFIEARLYADDKLISPQIATNILLDLYDTSARLIADAGAIHVPTLLLISGKDWVVQRRPQELLFERLSSTVKELEVYPDFYHSTFWERDRKLPIARTREFLQRQFESPAEPPSLLDADQRLVGEGHRTLGHGPDVALEAQVQQLPTCGVV